MIIIFGWVKELGASTNINMPANDWYNSISHANSDLLEYREIGAYFSSVCITTPVGGVEATPYHLALY